MRSVLRKKSFGSVRTFWLDRQLVLELALKAGRSLVAAHPEVVKVGIFGSIARGRAAPGSDLDVFVILRACDLRPIERSRAYETYFEEIGIATDMFCLTEDEASRSPFFRRNSGEAIWVTDGDTPPPSDAPADLRRDERYPGGPGELR